MDEKYKQLAAMIENNYEGLSVGLQFNLSALNNSTPVNGLSASFSYAEMQTMIITALKEYVQTSENELTVPYIESPGLE